MKEWCITFFRRILVMALFVIPVPLGIYSISEDFGSIGFILFAVLSLMVPLHYRNKAHINRGDVRNMWSGTKYLVYGWIVVLLIAMGILDMLTQTSLWRAPLMRSIELFIWMLVVFCLQQLLTAGFTTWFQRKKDYPGQEIFDCILITLPAPCAFLGMFLFPMLPAIGGEDMAFGLFFMFGLFAIALQIAILATFAFYYYPKRKYAPDIALWRRVARILVSAAVWFCLNSVFFIPHGAWYGTVLFTMLPIFQNSPLVYISPFVLEGVCVAIAVVIGSFVAPLRNQSAEPKK